MRLPDSRRLTYPMRTIFLGPMFMGLAILVLLAFVPQIREIYLGIIESRDYPRGALGLVLIFLLCALLDFWQNMLSTSAIDRIYPEHGDIALDRYLMFMRDLFSRLAAFLPLGGVAIGLALLLQNVNNTNEAYKALTKAPVVLPVNIEETNKLIPVLAPFLIWGIVFAIVGSVLLEYYVRTRIHARNRLHIPLRRSSLIAGCAISAIAILLPLVAPDYVVPGSQAVGPLAMTAIVLIVAVCFMIGLSYCSTLLRLPITGMVLMAVLAVSAFQVYRALNPDKAGVEAAASATTGKAQLHSAFDNWWNARKSSASPDRKYPIFIIAAEGGGIYATSAAAAFLTDMQTECANFPQHVFAVSAVSGGAVGSAIFAALNAGRDMVADEGCTSPQRVGGKRIDTANRTKAVVRSDHLSPALAMIWPDIVRKIIPPVRDGFDRSNVLERSFACAYDNTKAARPRWAPCVDIEQADSEGLRMPFANYWRPNSSAPALILAATWAETGFRAAFAPFPLKDISDGTMFSFYPRTDEKTKVVDSYFEAQSGPMTDHRNQSLIEAAFISARFPGIVPAWRRAKDPKRWNFVDGGYVDNSGATTALELFEELDKYSTKNNWPVSIHLILLTDADTGPDLSKVDSGTWFNDTVAPVTALLSVRGQLAGRAVRRAIERLDGDLSGREPGTKNPAQRVHVVNLEHRALEFPLGWNISSWTDEIVRTMLGKPDLCRISPDVLTNSKSETVIEVARTRYNNSCVKAAIRDLLLAQDETAVAPPN